MLNLILAILPLQQTAQQIDFSSLFDASFLTIVILLILNLVQWSIRILSKAKSALRTSI